MTTRRLTRIYRSIAAHWVEAMVMSDPMLFCSYLEALRAEDESDAIRATARVADIRRREPIAAGASLVAMGEPMGGQW